MNLSIREINNDDIPLIIDYFINADEMFLKAMGAIKSKLPSKKDWLKKLYQEIEKPNSTKEFYYVIWLLNSKPVGHSNINNIIYNKEATMHLHLWQPVKRKKGIGTEFVKMSIPYYFKNFKLKKLICEPYTQNIAPNKVLQKVGFNLIKKYETIPGWINFKQLVNRYEMSFDKFETLK